MRVYRWIFVIGLIVGLSVLFVMFSNERQSNVPKPDRSSRIAPEATAPDNRSPENASDRTDDLSENLNAPKLDLDQSSGPLVIVDSFPLDAQGAITDWRGLEGSAGHFDQLALLDGSGAADAGISTIDILIARGWAGDTGLGMRLSDVLLARCDRIVAHAKVTLDRPDVAKAVHPNLVRSGWEAQLLAGHLPSCGNDSLSAWAVVPGSPALLIPLIGNHSARVDRVGQPAVSHVSAEAVIRPEAYAPPTKIPLEILASRANLRRCGSTKCPVVGQIDQGTHLGAVLDNNGEWSLIGFEGRQGWLFNGLFRRGE